ncbi:AraC family transcriptional regulator [Rhizobium sp. FKL33]|uniref:AraC family transcriptional regulator n=1 Tax=Rhizobium sp. FKL33 TaxID=2562307 RepID=UPI001485AC88|nr:AraC family transcriptional regulator [Rhizobium sp. FKL33]
MQTQTKATDLHVRRDRYSDMDRQAAQLSGYGQIYRQLSRGTFDGSFTSIESGNGAAGVYVEKVNQTIEQVSAAPQDQAGLVFLCGDQPSARFGSRPFTPGTAMLLGPGVEVDFQSFAGTHICVLTHDHQALIQSSESTGAALPARGETRLIDNPAEVGRLVQRINAILRCALLATGHGAEAIDGQMLGAEIATIMGTMTALASACVTTRLPPFPTRTALFRQARDMIHDGLDIVSVTRLKTQLNVSRRTLEYSFQEATGMTPHAYIAAIRLDAIRRGIKSSGDSIGDIAGRYGVWHLSRFAQQFRDAFGALPSEMRMRAAPAKPDMEEPSTVPRRDRSATT